jgi:hypothetical protein
MIYRYFNLNIRHPQHAKLDEKYPSAAQYWLDKRKLAPIFYGTINLHDISTESEAFRNLGNSGADIKKFIDVGISHLDAQKNYILVTIDEGYVWFYEAISTVKMMDQNDESLVRDKDSQNLIDWPKVLPIKRLGSKRHVKDVPLVLSSMKSNQWMTRGTFREIEPDRGGAYLGNIAAIQSALNRWDPNSKFDPLDCLSSLEFETLIAKILEEHGCFVPAYKGGFLKDVDLIAKPTATKSVAGLDIESGKNIALQLKLSIDRSQLSDLSSEKIDYLIGLNDDKSLKTNFENSRFSSRCLGRSWLKKALQESPCTLGWLQHSLQWLPLNKWTYYF